MGAGGVNWFRMELKLGISFWWSWIFAFHNSRAQLGQAARHLAFIPEVFISNLNRNTECSGLLWWFSCG